MMYKGKLPKENMTKGDYTVIAIVIVIMLAIFSMFMVDTLKTLASGKQVIDGTTDIK
jgi:hypothetical protein